MRDGAVIPVTEPVQCVWEDTVFHMHVKHYGKKAGSFVLMCVTICGKFVPNKGGIAGYVD